MKEKKAVYVNGYIGLVGLILLVGVGAILLYLGMTSAAITLTTLGFIFWSIFRDDT